MTREELRKELDLGDYGDRIEDYTNADSSYIDDIFSEIADNATSVYYPDIAKYIATHIDEVNDYINEVGWGGDLYKAGQGAEYDNIYLDLKEHEEDILIYWALIIVYDKEIPSEMLEEARNNYRGNYNLFSQAYDDITDGFFNEDEDEEEELPESKKSENPRMKESGGVEKTFHLSGIEWDTDDDYGFDDEELEDIASELPEEDDVTIYLEDDEIDDWDIIQEKIFEEMSEMYGFTILGCGIDPID